MMQMEELIYDEDEILVTEEISEVPAEFYEKFHSFSVSLAKKYLAAFFEGQMMYCGGTVSRAVLLSPRIVSTVLNTTLIDGVDRVYELLTDCVEEFEQHPNVTNHMIYTLKVLERCNMIGVPTCFRGGILLAWVQLCLGIRNG